MDQNRHHPCLVTEKKANVCQWGITKKPLYAWKQCTPPLFVKKEIHSSSQFILTFLLVNSIKCLKQNVSPSTYHAHVKKSTTLKNVKKMHPLQTHILYTKIQLFL